MPVQLPNPPIVTRQEPDTWRICGLSMHNVAEPIRHVEDPETGTLTTMAHGYMIVEWEAGTQDGDAFRRQYVGTTRIDGDAFLAYLNDPTGQAIAGLLKLYLHHALIELGVFPAGQNVMTSDELRAITSFCASWLGRQ